MATLTKMHSLPSKMKITVHAEKLGKFSQNHVSFYTKYASFVFRSLKRPSFQKFLRWMLRKENIEENAIRDVQVRVFPLQRKNGKGLAGNCSTDRGEIRIFPKTLKFCQKLRQKFGNDEFTLYVRSRARAALIHELLHLKYASDEERVRELTREYFAVFTQDQSTRNPQVCSIYNMIFKPKTTKNVLKSID
jgi:DNA polymerase III delta prime subunit